MKWGLNLKFIAFTVFIINFISLVFSVVFVYQSRRALLNEFTKRGESLVKNLALNAELPLLIENQTTLTSLAQNLLQEKDVQRVRILNSMNQALVDIDKGRKLWWWQKEEIMHQVLFTPAKEEDITEDMSLFFNGNVEGGNTIKTGEVIGSIAVTFSRENIIKTLNLLRWWIFLAATFATIIGVLVAFYFSYTLVRPIQRLAKATSSIARGNWEERLEITRKDELGQLTESFNLMAASLDKKRDELETTYKELAQKERMAEIGKFSMMIAHELKNPIGIIKGSIDLLAKKGTKLQVRETMIGYIKDEVKRLNKLIDDFLAFARPMPPNKSIIDVNTIVKKVATHFMIPEAANKKVSLHLGLGDPLPIKADEHQIYQALLNLLNNAAQAIETQGDIYLKTDRSENWAMIQVSDTGVGISKEDKDRIFDPFFTKKAKGTGLGLSIVKKIIDVHNGHIQLDDLPEVRTTFTIFLPV
jgi:signal transduction histidine kinase